jgi:hypothetical protein
LLNFDVEKNEWTIFSLKISIVFVIFLFYSSQFTHIYVFCVFLDVVELFTFVLRISNRKISIGSKKKDCLSL